MKRKTKLIITAALILVFVAGVGLGAYGGGKTVTAKITYDNIKIVIDDQLKTPAEQPFTMNGKTYVPLRFIGDAFGKEVTWDQETKTVYIGGTIYRPVFITRFSPVRSDGDGSLALNQRTDISGISFDTKEPNTPINAWGEVTYDLKGLAQKVECDFEVSTALPTVGKYKATFYDQSGKTLAEVGPIGPNQNTKLSFRAEGINEITVKVQSLETLTNCPARLNIKNFKVSTREHKGD
ncbi:MAG: copper amine oxidase N-terminal domain-containing protein [Chitinophagales bacterium]